jgi:hypothetical protein
VNCKGCGVDSTWKKSVIGAEAADGDARVEPALC